MIGSDMAEWNAQIYQFGEGDQPDRISILTDELQGVCNVVLYQGKKRTSLSGDDQECQIELQGIEEYMIRLTPEAPLVGFHGMATADGLDSLGLILLDNLSGQCSAHASL